MTFAAFLASLGLGSAWVASFATAAARVLPSVLLVPAFGLRRVSLALRALFALMLALPLAATTLNVPAGTGAYPSAFVLLAEFVRGLPVALGAAIPLWSVLQVGALAQWALSGESGEQEHGPFATLFDLLAILAFFATGGPARLATALLDVPAVSLVPILRMSMDIARGVQIAVAIAAPVVIAGMMCDVMAGLLGMAMGDAATMRLLSVSARPLLVLLFLGIFWDRMLDAIGRWVAG